MCLLARLGQIAYDWQTLITGLLALGAAIAGVVILHKQIRQTQKLEDARRARKVASLKAVGPLSLGAIIEYAKTCTKELKALYKACGDEMALPRSRHTPRIPGGARRDGDLSLGVHRIL